MGNALQLYAQHCFYIESVQTTKHDAQGTLLEIIVVGEQARTSRVDPDVCKLEKSPSRSHVLHTCCSDLWVRNVQRDSLSVS